MTLKTILYDIIHHHPSKSLEQLAEETGVSASYLTRSALPDKDDVENPDLATGCRFPLKKLIPIIRASGDFRLLDYIESSLNRVAFELPKPKTSTEKLHKDLSRSIKEFGELVAAIGESMDDGKVTSEELTHCKKEGYEVIQAIAHMLHSLGRSSHETHRP